jgi:hypothetical protein
MSCDNFLQILFGSDFLPEIRGSIILFLKRGIIYFSTEKRNNLLNARKGRNGSRKDAS